MIACLDVHYQGDAAFAAAVLFDTWTALESTEEKVVHLDYVAAYEPGSFYKRELPCLLAVLRAAPPVNIVIIDGYVWLDEGKPGLGAHLYEALGHKVPIVGVAKTGFKGSVHACPVLRGSSKRPLYVTSAGMNVDQAADAVRGMHGEHRMPTLLLLADQLSRRVQVE
jgi:deoxyribonuclease V